MESALLPLNFLYGVRSPSIPCHSWLGFSFLPLIFFFHVIHLIDLCSISCWPFYLAMKCGQCFRVRCVQRCDFALICRPIFLGIDAVDAIDVSYLYSPIFQVSVSIQPFVNKHGKSIAPLNFLVKLYQIFSNSLSLLSLKVY